MALAAAGAVKGAIPKSGTVGAVVLLGGVLLIYWALYRSRDGQGLFGLGDAATRDAGLLDLAAAQGVSGVTKAVGVFDRSNARPGRPGTPTSPEPT